MPHKNKAVIMDRDGTLFREANYLQDPEKIEIYKDVFPALKKLSARGWKLIIGTNQSGVGRGYFSLNTMHEIHDRFLRLCKKNRLKIDEIFFCPHHPDDGCLCRKPQIGMLLAAAKKFNLDLKACVVIGDKTSDILWGQKAKAKTILVLTGYGLKHRKKIKKVDYVAKTLPSAVDWILKNEL